MPVTIHHDAPKRIETVALMRTRTVQWILGAALLSAITTVAAALSLYSIGINEAKRTVAREEQKFAREAAELRVRIDAANQAVDRLSRENSNLRNQKADLEQREKTLNNTLSLLTNRSMVRRNQIPITPDDPTTITLERGAYPDCTIGQVVRFWHLSPSGSGYEQHTVRVVGCDRLKQGESPCSIVASRHPDGNCIMTGYCNAGRSQFAVGEHIVICAKP